MPKVKRTGEVISWKEFFKRWKEGIVNLTQLQRLQNEARGNLISLIGYLLSLVALIIFRDKLIVSWFAYGLILVFVGSVMTTGLKWLTLRQQIKGLKDLDKKSINIKSMEEALNSMFEDEEINSATVVKGGEKDE